MIVGCDFRPSWQQVSWLDTETGETGEQKLVHAEGQAQRFYQRLGSAGADRHGSDGKQNCVEACPKNIPLTRSII